MKLGKSGKQNLKGISKKIEKRNKDYNVIPSLTRKEVEQRHIESLKNLETTLCGMLNLSGSVQIIKGYLNELLKATEKYYQYRASIDVYPTVMYNILEEAVNKIHKLSRSKININTHNYAMLDDKSIHWARHNIKTSLEMKTQRDMLSYLLIARDICYQLNEENKNKET